VQCPGKAPLSLIQKNKGEDLKKTVYIFLALAICVAVGSLYLNHQLIKTAEKSLAAAEHFEAKNEELAKELLCAGFKEKLLADLLAASYKQRSLITLERDAALGELWSMYEMNIKQKIMLVLEAQEDYPGISPFPTESHTEPVFVTTEALAGFVPPSGLEKTGTNL
jgi:hypothetical protein